jgi:hypothetical protein
MTIQPYQTMPAGLANGQPQGRQAQGLSIGVHAYPKMGKSSLGVSGPRPCALIDSEVAGIWTPGRKIYWDPARSTVPRWGGPGDWEICDIPVQSIDTLFAVQNVLASGQHPFNSISVDSVPAVAHRAMMAMAARRKMERDDWGQLLRDILQLIVGFKDLLVHPTNPVWSVVYVFPTHYDRNTRKMRPYLQGQSADLVPYQFDLMGTMYVQGTHPDGRPAHHLFTGPSNQYETGDRLWGRLPSDLIIGHPGMVPGWTVETMVEHAIASQ